MTPDLLLRTVRIGVNQFLQARFSQSPILVTGILSCRKSAEDKRIYFDELTEPNKTGFAGISLASDAGVREKMLPLNKQLCTVLGFLGVEPNSKSHGIWANIRVMDVWPGDGSQ